MASFPVTNNQFSQWLSCQPEVARVDDGRAYLEPTKYSKRVWRTLFARFWSNKFPHLKKYINDGKI